MFYRHHQSHPAFILGGRVEPCEAEPQPDQFKSQFARRLLSDGSQLTLADLEQLRQENVSLKQKVELCRAGNNKFDFLQTELQVLRERVGKISAEISLQDISTQHLLTSVHSITRQLSIYNQHDIIKSGIKRSKSCFQVNPRDAPAVKKRSKSVAGDMMGDQRRQRKLEEARQGDRRQEDRRQDKAKSSPARALRRVKTFLKPFRKTYKLERSAEVLLLGNSYLDTPEVKVLQCRLDRSGLEY